MTFLGTIAAGPILSRLAVAQCPSAQLVQLTPPDVVPGEEFGWSIDMDGEFLVAGCPRDFDNGVKAGAAYVYRRGSSAAEWKVHSKLLAPDGAPEDQFGFAVAISGNLIAVGAVFDSTSVPYSGSVYLFKFDPINPGSYEHIAHFAPNQLTQHSLFGQTLAFQGDGLVVGAIYMDLPTFREGAAFVFSPTLSETGSWELVQVLHARRPAIAEEFGSWVRISNNTLVIGAVNSSFAAIGAGAAYVFERTSSAPNSWEQSALLTAADAAAGDGFGIVAISNDTIVVGALNDDDHGNGSGSAYVFERDAFNRTKWTQVAKLYPSYHRQLDGFGGWLDVENDTVAIASIFADLGGPNTGGVFVFHRDAGGPGKWGQSAVVSQSDAALGDDFGYPVIFGDHIAVGATKSMQALGAVYIFENPQGTVPTIFCDQPASPPASCTALITYAGTASFSLPQGFYLSAQRTPGMTAGFFVYSTSPHGTAFPPGRGGLCLSGPTTAVALPLGSGGNAGQCDGGFRFDWNAYAQQAGFSYSSFPAGVAITAQFVFADPSQPTGRGASNAIAFSPCR